MDSNTLVDVHSPGAAPAAEENLVGLRLRQLRGRRGLSLRALAELSGLNINTLSLVENGKSSPSVSTLQQLARALDVPITAFFESEPVSQKVVFTPAGSRPQAAFARAQLHNLGKGLSGNALQPFIVTLNPGLGSGDQMIVHTGHEFVYCLKGCIHYRVDGLDYTLHPGDSLVFEAHLEHCWENACKEEDAQLILVLVPADWREEPGGRHFEIL